MNTQAPMIHGTVTPLFMGYRDGRETHARAKATFASNLAGHLTIQDLDSLQEAHDGELHIYADTNGAPVIESAIEKGGSMTESILLAEEFGYVCGGTFGVNLETARPEIVRTLESRWNPVS
jgi:hypothetical protein